MVCHSGVQFILAKIIVSSTIFYHCFRSFSATLVLHMPIEKLAGKDYKSLKFAFLHLAEISDHKLFEGLPPLEQLFGKPSSCLCQRRIFSAQIYLQSISQLCPCASKLQHNVSCTGGNFNWHFFAFSKCNPVSYVLKHEFSPCLARAEPLHPTIWLAKRWKREREIDLR